MRINRRQFIGTAALAGAAANAWLGAGTQARPSPSRTRAVAFDAFTIFDPRSIAAQAERLFPGQGAKLVDTWRTHQFEFAWLRTLVDRYVDFWQVTEEALTHAATVHQLAVTDSDRAKLMQAHLELQTWPDAPAALHALRAAGLELAFVSNFTAPMLTANVARSGLQALFESNLSTDRVGAYKPDPRAYRMALDAFGVAREQIVFAAFAGWDAAGASAFGYPTFWVDRMRKPLDELGAAPDARGESLNELVNFVAIRGGRS